MAFPSLVKMETEVVSNVISLSGGDDETVGSFTSGGTESIFMALKAARDWARHTYPQIEAPEMVVPVTAHPAWNKAAHYLDIKISMTPVKDDLRADVAAMQNAITKNTIILGGTAVTYPHGMVDPVEEIGALAEKKNLWLHVDACLGGLMLPFLKRLGHEIPPYDFSVPGVTLYAQRGFYRYVPQPRFSQIPDLCLRGLARGRLRNPLPGRRPPRRHHGGRMGGNALSRSGRFYGAGPKGPGGH
jgi:glutamate/tyrosine decarboxylase-like PLP-dependent enzyme